MKKLLLVLLLAGGAAAGAVYWFGRPGGLTVTRDTFTYAPARLGDMAESVSATGILHPQDVVVVNTLQPGTVVEVRAGVNDVVREGDVLACLDDQQARLKRAEAEDGVLTAEAGLLQAKALLGAADLAVDYQRDLQDAGGFRSELDQAEAKRTAARAGVKHAEARLQAAKTARDEAQLALDRTVIRVPEQPGRRSDGQPKRRYLVLEKKLLPGQVVGPQSPPLFTLAGDVLRMEVHAEVVEGDIGRVRPGLAAVFTVPAYPEDEVKFRGRVKEIRPLPANVKGAIYYTTVIEAENEKEPLTGQWRLRPGMTASVDVITRQKKGVWKIPGAALNFTMDEAYMTEAAKARLEEWRRSEGRDDWRPVWVWDERRGCAWPVLVRLGGLRGGEPALRDGEFHEALEWEAGYEPPPGGPNLIINAPAVRRGGLLDQPSGLKVA